MGRAALNRKLYWYERLVVLRCASLIHEFVNEKCESQKNVLIVFEYVCTISKLQRAILPECHVHTNVEYGSVLQIFHNRIYNSVISYHFRRSREEVFSRLLLFLKCGMCGTSSERWN